MRFTNFFTLLLTVLLCGSASAQFIAGRFVAKEDSSGLWYMLTLGGQIWEDNGMGGFNYTAVLTGANAGGMFIANGKMYAVRINTVKVYDLNPPVLVDTWNIPAVGWLVGICWDGDSTLYCHDQNELFSVNMNTGQAISLFNGISFDEQGMEYDPLADRILIARDLTPSLIMGYDLQTGAYDTVVVTNTHAMRDIHRACNDSQYLVSAGGTADGIIYSVPADFSNVGDTVANTYSQPYGVHYDPMNDVVAYGTEDSVPHVSMPCSLSTGVIDAYPQEASVEVRTLQDEVWIVWVGLNGSGPITIRLMDLMGRTILSEEITGNPEGLPYQLRTDGHAEGSYIVVLEQGLQRIATPFVLRR